MQTSTQNEEARKQYSEDARFKKWVHKDLAFISAASWDGVHIPADTLMSITKIKEAQKLADVGGSSFVKNPPKTNIIIDEKREKLADRLLDADHGSAVFENGKIIKINGVEQFTGEVEQGHHACIVIGRPAGGKSRVFANPLSNKHKARIIDSDTVKPWLDGYNEGYGAGYVQEESASIANRAASKAFDMGDNVIIPRIGGKSVIQMAKDLKARGYTVDLYFNEVSEETSIMRAASRFAEEGRYLSLAYLQTIGNKADNTFKEFAESGIFNYAEWRNNDVGFGEEPKLIWKTGEKPLGTIRGEYAGVGKGNTELAESQRKHDTSPRGGIQSALRRGTDGDERKFSLRRTSLVVVDEKAKQISELEARIKKQDSIITELRRQMTATTERSNNMADIRKFAKKVLAEYESDYDLDTLVDNLDKMYREIRS